MRVLYALIPVAVAAVYLFGWRVLALVGVSFLFAFLAEWTMVYGKNGKVSQAVWVTAALYGLSLPPTTPVLDRRRRRRLRHRLRQDGVRRVRQEHLQPGHRRPRLRLCLLPRGNDRAVRPGVPRIPGRLREVELSARFRNCPPDLAAPGLKVVDAITAATPMWSRRDYGFDGPALGPGDRTDRRPVRPRGPRAGPRRRIGRRSLRHRHPPRRRLSALDQDRQLPPDARYADRRHGHQSPPPERAGHRCRPAAAVHALLRRVPLCHRLHGHRPHLRAASSRCRCGSTASSSAP